MDSLLFRDLTHRARMDRLGGSHAPAWGISIVLTMAAIGLPFEGRTADANAPRVSVVAASRSAVEQTISVVGTVVPLETTLINADLEGVRIVFVGAEEGDLVVAGQVLARLDASKIDIELLQNDALHSSASALREQASSTLQSAMISREEADADLQRAQKLVPKGLLSVEILEQREKVLAKATISVDLSRQAVKVAEASLATAAATRQDIELRRDQSKIVAPVSGRIIRRLAKVGGVASSSGEALFVIANDDQFEVEAEISQSRFSMLAVGAIAAISLDDGGSPIRSAVRFVSPALADGTRLGRARLPLPQGFVAPIGAFASATIEVSQASGIFLPSSAITGADGEPSTEVLKNNRIERKVVTLGVRQDGMVQIRSGISEGDLVVVKSAGFMDEGDEAIPVLAQANAMPDGSKGARP